MAAPAQAAADNIIDLGSERQSGTDWVRNDDVITIFDSDSDGIAWVVLQGTSSGVRVIVAEDTKAIIEMNGPVLDFQALGMRGVKHGLELSPGSDVEVQLRDGTTSVLAGAYFAAGSTGGAGIFVPAESSLWITAPGAGTGELFATGSVAMPGIGGGRDKTTGEIQIDGGTIVAQGGDSASGIGSGWRGTAGPITIRGGNITATGGNGVGARNGGAGIGTAHAGTAGPIFITGGTINATGKYGGAGIGGGYASAAVKIMITGGDITATGDGSATGIGSASLQGGSNAKGMNQIVITGADTAINATSGRPVATEASGAVAAIGAGDGDGTRTETFIIVGGPLIMNGEEAAKNLTLNVTDGNTGAVAMQLPDAFTNMPESQVRVVRTINPEAKFALITTLTTGKVSFSTNGFNTMPDAINLSTVGQGESIMTFKPQTFETPLYDTGVSEGFLSGASPIMLGYLGFGVAAFLVTCLIGAYSARRRMERYRTSY
jgi:hypothetical protein